MDQFCPPTPKELPKVRAGPAGGHLQPTRRRLGKGRAATWARVRPHEETRVAIAPSAMDVRVYTAAEPCCGHDCVNFGRDRLADVTAFFFLGLIEQLAKSYLNFLESPLAVLFTHTLPSHLSNQVIQLT